MSTISAGTTLTNALVQSGDTTGNLVIQTNGTTTAMTIDTSQNVGIGTTSPSAKLNVATGSGTLTQNIVTIRGGGASGNFSGLSVQSNSGDEIFTVNNLSYNVTMATVAGNVGIGTSSPTANYKLDIAESNTGIAASAKIRHTAAGNQATIQFQNTTTGSAATDGLLVGTSATDCFIYNYENTPLYFATNNTERMRIDSSGNVVIGHTTASYRFQVRAAKNTTGIFLQQANVDATNDYSEIGFGSAGGTSTVYSAIRNLFTNPSSDSSTALTFSTTNGFTFAERARITSAGEFVVGKTSTGTGVGTYIDNTGVINTQKSGTANTSTTMEVYSTGASAFRFYVGMGGTIFATSTTITGISDQRLKENIRDLDDGLNSILALKPRKFDWKEGKGKDIKDDRGFVAQEFEQVFPDMIDEWKDPAPEGEEPYKSVRADLIPVLVKAIQDLKAITDAQATRIEALEAEVAAMKAGNGN